MRISDSQYEVISGFRLEFVNQTVTFRLQDDWKLHGPLQVVVVGFLRRRVWYSQAVVRT